MQVFVTGTGRCGSVCFSHACRHITNFSSGHETKAVDLIYCDNHIEVNTQLWIVIPKLVEMYPNAKWVHLVRDNSTCVPSIAALDHGEVAAAFAKLFGTIITGSGFFSAMRLYEAATQNIRANLSSLVSAGNKIEVSLENAKEGWADFWEMIDANGDFNESLRCWDTPVNTRADRGESV